MTIDAMQNSRNASKNAFSAVKANSGATAADEPDGLWLRFGGVTAAIYWAIHASCLLAIYTGVNAVDVALCLGLFWLRIFGITGGFHRYFAHRSFKTGRVVQFLLAFLGTSAIQKGPLWWAGTHRV
ncbi:MAG: hypothetical protein ACKVK6_12905, partial [bacterium]